MPTYDLIISDEAELDLLDTLVWYETQRAGLGIDFESEVAVVFNFIRRNPLAVQIRYDDIRIAFLNRFPYGIHFDIYEKFVRVIAVYHTSKDPKSWIERLQK